MSFQFRKSKKVGPLRVTASKRGFSASVGGAGVRRTKSTTGRSSTTARVPGTGAFWRKTKG